MGAGTLSPRWCKGLIGLSALALIAAGTAALTDATSAAASDDKPVSGPPGFVTASPSFAEEFDGSTLDTARWRLTYADPKDESPALTKRSLWNNKEREVYFDPDYLGLGINPFRISDGVLVIEARPLSGQARARIDAELKGLAPKFAKTALADVAYSSGMISSRGRFSQRYGYFEIRARWSGGKGLWPAFWLLPAAGGWPPEIDILEAHGDKPGISFHSLHSRTAKSETRRIRTATGDGKFHNYGALWLPDRIEFYIDGTKVTTMPTRSDMHAPMFMIANLAVGGAWPGDPDDGTAFPATMEIDHIRAWKVDPATQRPAKGPQSSE